MDDRDEIRWFYNLANDHFNEGYFDSFDMLLKYLDPTRMRPEVALGVLTAAGWAKDRLKNRVDFYERTRKHFLTIMTISEAAANLKGLE